jgi:flagellar biosynthesis protein FlhA
MTPAAMPAPVGPANRSSAAATAHKPGRFDARGGSATREGLRLSRIAAGEMAVPLAVLGILLAMVMPLPTVLLDVLISANITLSTIILLVSMHIRRPVEFSVFPSALLLTTLFRLALNVSSSRLILLHGATGTGAAGEVIESFGNFVVGGNYVIGIVIFLVLIAIQYVVINHGAVRISEVTARFTLDALPGKQMSIDADLNAGLINESEAKSRRKALSAEAEFYGAMDGATRFTQRDAVASILITAINIFAGFLIGVFQNGMELVQALETFTVLTIGDGLVTVIPALMISISGGLIVTHASSDQEMGADFRAQIFGAHRPMLLAAGALVGMALFPGLPKIPFLLLGAGVGYAAFRLKRKHDAASAEMPETRPAAPRDDLEGLLRVEPIAVEVGLGLVRLVEGGADSPLLRRISGIRKQLASELGFLLPPVRVTDNLALSAREYSVLVRGAEVARYELLAGCDLAIPPQAGMIPQQATPTEEPAFGLAAFWVPKEHSERLRASGYTVVDPVSVMGTHLGELIRRHAHELLSRQDAKRLLDRAAEEQPRLVEDLVPKLLPLSTVQRVFQNLLRERVPIRDVASILESLGESALVTRNPVLLTEFARQALRRSLIRPLVKKGGELAAYFLDGQLERAVEQAVEHSEHASHLNLPPQRIRELIDACSAVAGQGPSTLLTSSGARYFVRQILEAHAPQMMVLSHGEIPAGIRVASLGVLRGGNQ